MRLKGINPIEQHVEKIVLALALAVLVGVLLWQFASPPAKMKVGVRAPREVPLASAWAELKRDADAIKGEMDDPTPDGLPTPSVALLERLTGELESGVAPHRTIAGVLGREMDATGNPVDNGTGIEIADNTGYLIPKIPAPSSVQAAKYQGTVHPVEAARGLAPLLPAEQPFDKAMVSIEGLLDGRRLASSFVGDGSTGRPLPQPWIGNTQIFDVELERQKMNDDGTWGPTELIDPMPGRLSLRPEIADGVTQEEMDGLIAKAREQRAALRTPQPAQFIYGEEWVQPFDVVEAVFDPAQREEIERLKTRLQTARREYDRVLQRIADSGENPLLERRRDDLYERLQTIAAELRVLGVPVEGLEELKPEGDPGTGGGFGAPPPPPIPDPLGPGGRGPGGRDPGFPGDPGGAGAEPSLLDNPGVTLWRHDLTVERGATYRYRLRVVINSPFFGTRAALQDDQKALSDEPLMKGEASAWTDPITVDPAQLFFVTDAAPAGQFAAPRATTTVYTFFKGYYREASVVLNPGDRVAAVIKAPDLPLPDVPELDADGKLPRDPEPGRPADPNAPAPEVPNVDVSVSLPWVIAEIELATGGGRNADDAQVYVVGPDGRVGLRLPSVEMTGTQFQRAAYSAEQGKQQVNPRGIKLDPLAPAPGVGQPADPFGPGGDGGPPPPRPGSGRPN